MCVCMVNTLVSTSYYGNLGVLDGDSSTMSLFGWSTAMAQLPLVLFFSSIKQQMTILFVVQLSYVSSEIEALVGDVTEALQREYGSL